MHHPLMPHWVALCLASACFGAIGMVVAGALPFGWPWFLIEAGSWAGCIHFGWHAHKVMKEMS